MSHPDTLVTAASLMAGFGAAIMAFRLQRELDIEEKNCCASAIMLAGYIPSILAHYKFFVGLTQVRSNPAFREGVFLAATAIGALTDFVVAYRAQAYGT